MKYRLGPIKMARLVLLGQSLLWLALGYFLAFLPLRSYLAHRNTWRQTLDRRTEVQDRLEDRQLLEVFDETFRQELDHTLQKLQPFLENQQYLRELSETISQNKLSLQSMAVDREAGLVRIILEIEGPMERLVLLIHQIETHAMPMRLQEWRSVPKGNDLSTKLVLWLKEIS